MLDPLIEGNAGAKREDQDGDDKGPEIQLHPVAEGMLPVRLLRRLLEAVQHQDLVSRIDQRMHALAQHRRTASKKGRREFRHRDERIADKRRIYDFFRSGCHKSPARFRRILMILQGLMASKIRGLETSFNLTLMMRAKKLEDGTLTHT